MSGVDDIIKQLVEGLGGNAQVIKIPIGDQDHTSDNVVEHFSAHVQRQVDRDSITPAEVDLAVDICLAAADAAFQNMEPAGDIASESLVTVEGPDEGKEYETLLAQNSSYRMSADAFYAGLIRCGFIDKEPDQITQEDKATAFLEGAAILQSVLPTLVAKTPETETN